MLDGLPDLQTPALAHRLGDHRGRGQDCVHTAAQAFGDGVDQRGRTGHPGLAGDLAEWRLGCSLSALLGVETHTCHSRAYDHRRSAYTRGSVGLGKGAITPSETA